MNNIDEMPAKCKSCPYWEVCEYPGICQDTEPKLSEIGNINAEIAENPQNRPTDGLIRKRDAIDALTTYISNVYKAMVGKRMPTDKCRQAAESVLGELPTVQPKRGKWVKISPASIYECSKCGKHVMTNDISAYDFCHGCGADMRGGDNGKT